MNQTVDAQAAFSSSDSARVFRKGIEILLFILVLAVFFYTPDPAGDVKYFVLGWGGFVLGGAWVIWSWRHRQTFRRPPLFLDLLLVFVGLHVVASLFGGYVSNSFVDVRKFWALLLLYLVASQVYRSPGHIRRTMLVVCIAVAVSSAYALICQRYGFEPFPWSNQASDVYTNLPATFGNPNFAAHTLVLTIIMALFLGFGMNLKACLGLAVLFIVHLRFTHQRAGLLALGAALALVCVAVFVGKRMRRPVMAVAVTVIVTALLGAMGAAQYMAYSKLRDGHVYPLDLSLLVRYKSYCSAAKMILDKPLLGYGTGNYKIEYPPFWTPYEQRWFAQESKMNSHVHNDMLEVAADAGLPAAGVYLAFLTLGMCYGLLLGFTEKTRERRLMGFAFAAMFCAFFVDGVFGFNLRVPVSAALIFVMAGALDGYLAGKREELVPAQTPGRLRWHGYAWRLAVLWIGVICVVLDSGVFASQLLLQRASAALHSRNYDYAIMLARWGESFAPGNWQFALQRATAHIENNQHAEAVAAFEDSLRLHPNYIPTLNGAARAELGRALAGLMSAGTAPEAAFQSLDKAAAYAQRARHLSPTFPQSEDMLGRIAAARALTLGKTAAPAPKVEAAWREAEGHFAKALEYGAKNTTELYNSLAQSRLALNNPTGAEDAMLRATQADAMELNWPQFYEFAVTSKQYAKFMRALEGRIARLTARVPVDHASLATAYLWMANIRHEGFDDPDAAESAYRNAIHHAADRPALWSAYARFAQATNRMEAFRTYAVSINSELLADGRQPLPHLAAIARVWKNGPSDIIEASAYLGEVVQGKVPVPGLKPTELDMSWALRFMAEEANAASVAPEQNAIALLHLGIVSAAIDDLALAEWLFPQAMRNLPANLAPSGAQYWADVLLRLRRVDEALDVLQSNLARNRDNPDLRLALARTLAIAGRKEEAAGQYQALLTMPTLEEAERRKAQAEFDALAQK